MAKYYDRCWNPLFGCTGAFKGCDKCFAKSLMERRNREWDNFGSVKINKKQLYRRFDDTPQLISVCTQSDLFQGTSGKADQWIVDVVLMKCNANRQNNYLFLTKFIDNLLNYFDDEKLLDRLNKNHLEPFLLDNMAFGVSVCCMDDLHRIDKLKRARHIKHGFVAFEPLLEDLTGHITTDDLKGMEWVIVGAQTGEGNAICRQEWMKDIVAIADELGIPVFVNAVNANDGKVTTEFDEMDEALRRSDIPFLPNR